MNSRIYIDINNQIGKRSNIINNNVPYSIEDFLKEHNKIGIDLSMAISSKSIPYSIVLGNKEIIDIAQKHDEICPIATLYPGIEYDIDNFEQYFQYLYDQGIKGIYLDLTKLFEFIPNLFNNIFTFSRRYNLPIMVSWDDIQDKYKFFTMMNNNKDLKLILLNLNWSFKKFVFEYMKENKNIYIGMNGFNYQGMIEDVCNNFSSKRLLFASGYPYYNIGASKSMLEYADISEKEKDDISYKNALNLFNIKKIKKRSYDLSQDTIANLVDNGETLNKFLPFPIIDVHTHFTSDDAKTVDWIGGGKSIDNLIKVSQKLGISEIRTSAMDGLLFDGITGNKAIDEAINHNQFKIRGYVTANPYYDEDIRLAINKLHNPHYYGVKLYPSKNWYPYDGELYKDILNEASNLGKYFLLHGSPEEAERVMKKYPHLNVLLAHATQSYEFMDKVIALSKKYPQLYVDICCRYIINGAIEYLVNNIGSDRVLFGSDSNLLSQEAHLGWLGYSNLSYEEKMDILSNNATKLVKKRK